MTSVRRSTRGRGVLLHLLLLHLLLFLQTLLLLFREAQTGRRLELILGLLLRLMTILTASRTAYPASHRDHLSLFAGNDDEFNSHSEDNQDLAPDTLHHSGLWSLGIGHTGNPSDHKHSAHRLQSVRPDSVVRWSILLNRALLELRSELEHWSASLEPDIVLMLLVHHGGITAHIVWLFSFVTLTQVNFSGFVAQASCQDSFSLLRLCLSETS